MNNLLDKLDKNQIIITMISSKLYLAEILCSNKESRPLIGFQSSGKTPHEAIDGLLEAFKENNK